MNVRNWLMRSLQVADFMFIIQITLMSLKTRWDTNVGTRLLLFWFSSLLRCVALLVVLLSIAESQLLRRIRCLFSCFLHSQMIVIFRRHYFLLDKTQVGWRRRKKIRAQMANKRKWSLNNNTNRLLFEDMIHSHWRKRRANERPIERANVYLLLSIYCVVFPLSFDKTLFYYLSSILCVRLYFCNQCTTSATNFIDPINSLSQIVEYFRFDPKIGAEPRIKKTSSIIINCLMRYDFYFYCQPMCEYVCACVVLWLVKILEWHVRVTTLESIQSVVLCERLSTVIPSTSNIQQLCLCPTLSPSPSSLWP